MRDQRTEHVSFLPTRPKAIVVAISSALAGAGTAHAQDTAIEEIVVTATKRAESLQDIPLAVTAFTSADIEKRNFQSFEDYADFVPGLSYGQREPGGTSIVFRGVAASGLAYGARSSSCVYLDEQPITAAGLNPDPRLIDIERVEALRGPQGTLFGDSCQSGALRTIANKPDVEAFDSWIDVTGAKVDDGDFGYDVSAMVNIPLGRNLALRLSGFRTEEAGFVDNVLATSQGGTFTNADMVDDDVNGIEYTGGRATLRWLPNDDWTVDITAMVQNIDQEGFGDVNFDAGDLNQIRFDEENLEDFWYQVAINIEARLGWADASLNVSYFDRKFRYEADATDYQFAFNTLYPYYAIYDFGGDPFKGFAQDLNDTDSFTVEARLSTPADSDSRWRSIVGIFYNQTDTFVHFESGNESFNGSPAFNYLNYVFYYYTGNFAGPTNVWFASQYEPESETVAIFGEFSFDFTDNFTITTGGRWFRVTEQRQTFIAALMQGDRINPATDLIFTDESSDIQETGFVPKLNVEYRFTDDHLVYFTFSRGFRFGGGNTVRRTSILPRAYDSDFLTNYEFGAKTTWLDGRLVVNAAAFKMNWDGIQIQVNDPQPGVFALGFVNFPEAEINGFEADFHYVPSNAWDIGGSVTFLDAKISKTATLFPNSPAPLTATKGLRLPITPEWKASAWVEYAFQSEFFGAQPYFRFDFAHVGDSLNSLSGIEPIVFVGQNGVQDAYDKGDLKIGLESEMWSASFFIDNLWDERGQNFISNRWAKQRLSIIQPRTFGFSFRRRFN